MKRIWSAQQLARASAAGLLLVVLAAPAAAIDLKTPDGSWTFSFDGNVNVDYIFSSCQSASSAVAVDGGLTCVGSASGSSVSNIGNGLLPAAFTFGVSTTQDGIDLAAHLGLYPGIATNDGGSPNLQTGNGPTNTALGTTGLDVRQVYLTFGNKDMGTFTLGRNIGLFGADAILNDMTLPGVGAPGSAATPFPSNTTLGGIGFGYIYTDWLAQIDYTTPDISGFNLTVGVFDPINSLSDAAAPAPKSAPGLHAKAAYTMPLAEGTKLYLSATLLTQKQNFNTGATTSYSYTGTGFDVFAKLDVQDFEVIGYYYHGDGLGTTALFNLGDFDAGQTRTSDGFLAQATYKIGQLKVGLNYGESKLDTANAADAAANPALVADNKKLTAGLYYSLTKNLMLLAEYSNVKSDAQVGGSNSANTVNVGAYLGF
ncbi:MAG TPA: porin [Steroidobacteraceae bacterium]|nr:porin [Steroidobacteraceae bacterium]